MKTPIILLAAVLYTTLSYSQQPKKKDAKIIVTPTDTTNLFNRITIALFEQGYNPDIKDEKAGIVISKEKDFRTYSVRIRAIVTSTTITFSGQGRFYSLVRGDKDDDFEDIYYAGAKGSDLRNAWEEIDKIAKRFGNNINYSK